MGFVCPACGFPDLEEAPRDSFGGGSFEICPSCGIEFGYHDEAGGNVEARKILYDNWRQKWADAGMHWHSVGITEPKDWNPIEQLRNLSGIS